MCEQHSKERIADRKRNDRERDKPFLHLYSTVWKKMRKLHLMSQPLCVECLKTGRVTAAVVVDHIVDHKGSLLLFYDTNNLQSLCTKHHNIKTCKTAGGFGNETKL